MRAIRSGAATIERLADLGYRGLERFRDPRAFELARQPGEAPDFAGLAGARQCLLVSFKRSGEPVPTTVNFGLSDHGRLYFRSEPRSGKLRRIRRDPHVRVGPCDLRGKPLGPLAEGSARVVAGSDAERAEGVVAANWTLPMTVLERALDRLPVEIAYVEVTPRSQARATGGP